MGIVLVWAQLEWRRHWRSLTVLALLIALATATVLTACAGARRGQTSIDRLLAQTLPATVTVLPNQPGFGWSKIAALPEVSALATFAVANFWVAGGPSVAEQENSFPFTNTQIMDTIERPVVLACRRLNPARAGEVVVTPALRGVLRQGRRRPADPAAGQSQPDRPGLRRVLRRPARRAAGPGQDRRSSPLPLVR